jgi:hypothetical protein
MKCTKCDTDLSRGEMLSILEGRPLELCDDCWINAYDADEKETNMNRVLPKTVHGKKL